MIRPLGRRLAPRLTSLRASMRLASWLASLRLAPLRRASGLALVVLAGAMLGVLVGGHTTQDIGPFRAELSLTPSLRGDTSVELPPLGSLRLDSHDGPAHLTVRLDSLDEARTRAVVADTGGLDRVGQDAVDQLSYGVRRLALQTAGSGVLGAMLLTALVYRSRRRAAIAGCAALAVLAATGIATQLSFRPDAIQEPRYEGLLVNAPAVVGDARRIASRYEEYREQLQRLVTNVTKLYGTISSLPVYEPDETGIKVLHISDLHLNPAAWTVVRTVADQFNVDVVADTGDITDWGSEPEASYVDAIGALRVPYVYVRGNHDSAVTTAAVARQPNAIVLDGGTAEVAGLTFAGTGDPRFTPDKSTDTDDERQRRDVVEAGRRLADTIRSGGKRVDVALVHDPISAPPLSGVCPLVLAGHKHQREVRRLDPPVPAPSAGPSRGPAGGPSGGPAGGPSGGPAGVPAAPRERTLLMVEGSTGGAGLRGLERDDPLPLALSILYFDRDGALQAYDEINVGGVGLTEVSLQRHLVQPDGKSTPTPANSPS